MNEKPLLEIKPVDREFYDKNLRGFLPRRIIDIHTHVWLDQFKRRRDEKARRSVSWPARVALDNSIEDHIETYRLMMPGCDVTPMIFSSLKRGDDIDAANAYISDSARRYGFPALIWSDPLWPADELERRIKEGGFLGVKSYLDFADESIPAKDITIFDYFPHHHLEIIDKLGLIMMLHIPRPARLRDPVNLEQMVEIEKKYPNVKVIIAHVGRAYCIEDVGEAFDVLSETRNMKFDISANTNEDVFDRLIKFAGPKRILFGSDMPILRMRMRRICEDGRYINLVPPGLYGDVSGDPNMREVDAEEGARLTFFLYEEIDAFRRAAANNNLTRNDIKDIFYNNAVMLLEEAGWKNRR